MISYLVIYTSYFIPTQFYDFFSLRKSKIASVSILTWWRNTTFNINGNREQISFILKSYKIQAKSSPGLGYSIIDFWLYPVVMVVLRSVKSETGKISLRPRVKIAQSPHEARSAEWGDWAIFTRGLREIFPVSDFTDLRTSITTGYNHKISMNKHEYFPKICNRPGDWSVLGSGTWGRQQNLLSGVSLINITLPRSNEGSSVLFELVFHQMVKSAPAN